MSLKYDLDPEARCWKSKYERDDEAFDEMAADEFRRKFSKYPLTPTSP
jgi:hypothetical protein